MPIHPSVYSLAALFCRGNSGILYFESSKIGDATMDYRFPPDVQEYVDEMIKKGVYSNERDSVINTVRDMEGTPIMTHVENTRA